MRFLLTTDEVAGGALVEGRSTILLRRSRPRGMTPGDAIYVATENDDGARIVGVVEVEAVQLGAALQLARTHSVQAGFTSTRSAYERLNGSSLACAIAVCSPRALRPTVVPDHFVGLAAIPADDEVWSAALAAAQEVKTA